MSVSDYFKSDYYAKLHIVGDCGVGKTSIIKAITKNMYDETYMPIPGISCLKVMNINDQTIELRILEIPAYKEIRSILDIVTNEDLKTVIACKFVMEDSIIIVYDITNKKSFDNLSQWISLCKIHENRFEKNSDIIIVGNKCEDEAHREVSIEMGQKIADDNGCIFIETSSKNNVNIQELFETIAIRCIEYNHRNPMIYATKMMQDMYIQNKYKQNKFKCSIL